MDTKELRPQTTPVLNKVLSLLADLKGTPAGRIIHSHIEQMLAETAEDHRRVEEAYASFLDMLLEACISQIPSDNLLHTHLRLVQLRLTPPLTVSELGALSRCVEAVADEISNSGSLRGSDLAPALAPVLEGFGVPMPPAVVPSRAPKADVEEGQPQPQAEHRVNAAYRAHLDEKREAMQKLQQDFISQIGEAVGEHEAFGNLLQDALAAVRQAGNGEDLEARRQEILQALQHIAESHDALTEKFSRAKEYLSIIEDDNQQLSDELDRVRLLSLTDELTGLPNRRAFMRRLEDEVSRVQRHGSPLGLVIMDLDHFKRINDLHGHAAGDAVLRSYAQEILSIFRHHDLVARYGGEEFAVLLPNTDQVGVCRALDKVRRRVSEVEEKLAREKLPIPTFSAGVAEYGHGETPSGFIERADAALYEAKRKGRNRVEVHGLDVNAAEQDSAGL